MVVLHVAGCMRPVFVASVMAHVALGCCALQVIGCTLHARALHAGCCAMQAAFAQLWWFMTATQLLDSWIVRVACCMLHAACCAWHAAYSAPGVGQCGDVRCLMRLVRCAPIMHYVSLADCDG